MSVFDVDFHCWLLTLIFIVDFQCFSKCRFPNKIVLSSFLRLNYNFTMIDINLYFSFFFSIFVNFVLLYYFSTFFLFLSFMLFCFFLFFILSSQNRTYFTMITLGHHTTSVLYVRSQFLRVKNFLMTHLTTVFAVIIVLYGSTFIVCKSEALKKCKSGSARLAWRIS